MVGTIYIIRNNQTRIEQEKASKNWQKIDAKGNRYTSSTIDEHYICNRGNVFGTYYSITYRSAEDRHEAIRARLAAVDNSLSPFNKNSLISAINENRDTIADAMFTAVFNLAQKVSEKTGGAFDITVAPLVNAWGFGFKNGMAVDSVTIDSLCRYIGYKSITLNDGKITKQFPQTMLDCSAIAKGYGCDAVAELLTENGVTDFLVEIGGEVAVCSSIMPQKRNPVSLEMARAKAGHIIGGQTAITTILKGVAFSNTMDLFEIPLPYWQMVSQVKQMLVCMIESVTYCRVRKERAVRQAAENLCTVTSLADYMVKKYEISFTDAHDIVGNIVNEVLEDQTLIAGFTPQRIARESQKILNRTINMTEDEIASVLDPCRNVETKVHAGGPSRASVENMIRQGFRGVNEETEELFSMRRKVEDAYSILEKKADVLVDLSNKLGI